MKEKISHRYSEILGHDYTSCLDNGSDRSDKDTKSGKFLAEIYILKLETWDKREGTVLC